MGNRLFFLLIIFVVFGVFTPQHAAAEIMDTSRKFAPGQVSLAFNPQFGFSDGAPWSLNAHQAVGLRGGLDLVLRQAVSPNNEWVYLGGGVKWNLVPDKSGQPGVALFLGGHYITGASITGLDGTLLIDNNFGSFTLYGALDMNIEFFDPDPDLYFALLGGAAIHVKSSVDWFVELGFALGDDRPRGHYVATGPRIYF